MAVTFYRCEVCGNIVEKVINGGGPLVCCGKPMTELVPGTTDAAVEKHVPVVETEGNRVCVSVGSVEHPMMDAHYIQFIALETNRGVYRADLKPGEAPSACFLLGEGEDPVCAYEYCNLHGLWAK